MPGLYRSPFLSIRQQYWRWMDRFLRRRHYPGKVDPARICETLGKVFLYNVILLQYPPFLCALLGSTDVSYSHDLDEYGVLDPSKTLGFPGNTIARALFQSLSMAFLAPVQHTRYQYGLIVISIYSIALFLWAYYNLKKSSTPKGDE